MAYSTESVTDSLLAEENTAYNIPTWEDLRRVYDAKWLEQKSRDYNE